MARKSQFFKNDSQKNEPLIDDLFKPSNSMLFPEEEFSSKPFLEEKPTRSFLDEEIPLASLKDFFEPSAPQKLRKNPFIAIWSDKKGKLLKIFLISGGGIAMLLLILKAGSYLLNNSASLGQRATATANKATAPPSNLSGKSPSSTLSVAPSPLIPVPEENKSPQPLSPAKKIKAPSPPKPKENPRVATYKKVEKNADRIYKLYINRKFILEETRAISLKLSLLGIENKIAKRKDGGYTIFAGAFKELSKARDVKDKVIDAGYRASIYSVVED